MTEYLDLIARIIWFIGACVCVAIAVHVIRGSVIEWRRYRRQRDKETE